MNPLLRSLLADATATSLVKSAELIIEHVYEDLGTDLNAWPLWVWAICVVLLVVVGYLIRSAIMSMRTGAASKPAAPAIEAAAPPSLQASHMLIDIPPIKVSHESAVKAASDAGKAMSYVCGGVAVGLLIAFAMTRTARRG